MKPQLKGKIREIRKFLKKQHFVRFAYLFGSYASGKTTELSDFDFAFYLDGKLSGQERFEKRLFLINELCKILGTDKVDVVTMNDVDYELNFEIIKGINIFSKGSRLDLETKIMSEYLDRRYYDERYYRFLLDKIIKEGII